jgi:3-hydroxybutyryl-CoA dehydratase
MVTVRYKIKEIDPARRRSRSGISLANQNGDLVASGEHILEWVPNHA